jgi:carbon storage regulator
MLVIRRHPGEAIQIGEEVEVVVIECGPGRVKLGIVAPKWVTVTRAEVRLTREQNLQAARAIEVGMKFELPSGWKEAGLQIQGSERGDDKEH